MKSFILKVGIAAALVLSLGSFVMFANFQPVQMEYHLEIDGIPYGRLINDQDVEYIGEQQKTVELQKYSDDQASLYHWAKSTSDQSSLANSKVTLIKKDTSGRVVESTRLIDCKPLKWKLVKNKNNLYFESVELAFQVKEQ